jgi:hypothetical protein
LNTLKQQCALWLAPTSNTPQLVWPAKPWDFKKPGPSGYKGKVVSGRRARQILFGAYRKQFRRWRIVAEKDRRNQQAWAPELRRALGQVAWDTTTSRR